MSEEIKQLLGEMNTAWKQFQGKHAEIETEIKKVGEARQEDVNTLQKLNARLDEMEIKAKRPAQDGGKFEHSPEAKAAFLKMLRNGAVSAEERKALSLADDTQGGFLAPPEFVEDILKGVVLISPVRQVAKVRQTSQRSVLYPKRTGTFAAQWVAEQGTRNPTTGLTYGLDEIPSHEMYALVDISMQDLEDSAFNLEAELNSEISTQFAKAEGAAFVGGSAVGQPEGILSNSILLANQIVNNGSATVLAADSLINLFYTLKDVYAQEATWLLQRATVGAIRKLKDANGQYLWAPGFSGNIAGSAPATILGKPYLETIDMPAVASGSLPIALGDFGKGYLIVDRIQMAMVRDNLTQATSGNIRFIARKRVGGQVVIPEAIVALKMQ